MDLAIGHTGVVVDDLARMRDFYARVLGLTETLHTTLEGAHIDGLTGLDGVQLEFVILGTEDRPQGVELLKYHAHPSAPTDPAPNRSGMNHVHSVTGDLDAVVAALQAEDLPRAEERLHLLEPNYPHVAIVPLLLAEIYGQTDRPEEAQQA
ncbi:MAG: VOC family protein, partial [Chloroflexota bacterium]|nr:VOC family protein [Chloroflexota bacterium]